MKLDDYFIALTVALLTCDESHLLLAQTALDKVSYEFHSPGALQKISVGATENSLFAPHISPTSLFPGRVKANRT